MSIEFIKVFFKTVIGVGVKGGGGGGVPATRSLQ